MNPHRIPLWICLTLVGCELRVDLPSGQPGEGCFSDGTCVAGLICAEGFCIAGPECVDDEACMALAPPSRECVMSRCVDGRCEHSSASENSPCLVGGRCSRDAVCQGARECELDTECDSALESIPECSLARCLDGECTVEPDSRPGTLKSNGLSCDYAPDDPNLQVLSLRILDAETGELERTLSNWDVLDLDRDPTVVFDATTTESVSSIVWQSNGIIENVENTAPWGDRISHYEPGLNSIALVPHSDDNAAGSAGTPLELTLQIRGYGIDATTSRVTSLLLLDTNTAEEMVLGAVGNIERSNTRFIRAETAGAVDRVEFRSRGAVVGVAGQAPFELSTEELPLGEQELLVFPFESDGFRTEFLRVQLTVR